MPVLQPLQEEPGEEWFVTVNEHPKDNVVAEVGRHASVARIIKSASDGLNQICLFPTIMEVKANSFLGKFFRGSANTRQEIA